MYLGTSFPSLKSPLTVTSPTNISVPCCFPHPENSHLFSQAVSCPSAALWLVAPERREGISIVRGKWGARRGGCSLHGVGAHWGSGEMPRAGWGGFGARRKGEERERKGGGKGGKRGGEKGGGKGEENGGERERKGRGKGEEGEGEREGKGGKGGEGGEREGEGEEKGRGKGGERRRKGGRVNGQQVSEARRKSKPSKGKGK